MRAAGRARPGARARRAEGALALLLAAGTLAGCVSPAWDDHDYGLKAAASAEAVASTVTIARHAVGGHDRLTTPYLKVLLTGAVTDVRSVDGQFAGVQPPSDAAERVGQQLLDLTGRAEDELAGLLVQVRRGGLRDPAGAVRELRTLGEDLQRFGEAHR
ncbi:MULTISPECIES: hypothetical protein [Streptosporangium]|uniref:DUF305 domain-containing protein n=1 Tax=Streptosporangium brasiliense TaxID=47480 RepID=A0ABT9RGB2_9ACTN|nr:hypothetical protein [Streptosporangium brasiliense]MDP9867892.1 hypothetical protein [Streptosporangium brasiliense]